MSRTVIVLGGARSGTSLTAGILHSLGVPMVTKKGRTCNGNPHSAFEDETMVTWTVQWKKRLDRGDPISLLAQEYQGAIKGWIKQRTSASGGMWGWKSAQTHYSIDLVMPCVTEPCFVCVFRNVLHQSISHAIMTEPEIFTSQDRSLINKPRTVAHGRVLSSMGAVVRGLLVLDGVLKKYPQVPKIMLAKEDISADPQSAASKLSDFLGIPFDGEKRRAVNSVAIKGYSCWNKKVTKLEG